MIMSTVKYVSKRVVQRSDSEDLLRNIQSDRLARYCFHAHEDAELHVMLIALAGNREYPIHRHTDTDEVLVIVEGEITLQFYDDRGRPDITHKLTASENISIIIDIHRWHSVRAGGSGASFLEVKRGPFVQNAVQYMSPVEVVISD